VKKSKAKRLPSERVKQKRVRGFVTSALIATGVAAVLLVTGLLDRDTGAGHWIALRRDAAAAKKRIAEIEARIAAHEAEAAALKSDPLAIEGAIRGDLGLARPGEWVVREEETTSLRNP
jgi:cell division protein FtsB